ncbi:MAG: phosphatase PAP2 family protein [Clostridia bacterium]|nr:phosphatase PAP2 family protein [Clostridia bacterium]
MTELAAQTMPVLHALAGIRSGALNSVMGLITYLGDEKVFVIIGLIVLWCFSKRGGLYMLTVGFSISSVGQALKMLFRVARPWVLEEGFGIVESARPGADGWSLPSGHTLVSVGTYGGMAAWFKHKGVRALGIALAILVPFSRMYLGVHTPLDIALGAGLALIAVFGLRGFFRKSGTTAVRSVLALNLLLAAVLMAVMSFQRYTAPTAEDAANWTSGIVNLWQLVGADAAIWLAYEVDERWLHYDTRAAWWAQLIKIAGGAALVLALRTLGKKVFGSDGPGSALSNFISMGAACCLWPMTFKYFAKTAHIKEEEHL